MLTAIDSSGSVCKLRSLEYGGDRRTYTIGRFLQRPIGSGVNPGLDGVVTTTTDFRVHVRFNIGYIRK